MGDLIYSTTVSLDGFIAGPDGELDWSVPSPELHRFHNEQVRELAAHLCGRRLYETMLYWETAEESGSLTTDYAREFAAIWKALPKIVFSRTLETVEGNATLVREVVAEQIVALKAQADRPLGVGGADLAGALTKLALVDEYRIFVSPAVLGAGAPCFPALGKRIDLELVETRTFASGVVYLRYRRV
ncbi:MAG TPA: dihydrofolate reductase family protein [Solirubrobacteraceae bacterium]|nr:dihydrofolate reductase family protein [Solirubrobacteraceae bacterium]